MQAYLLSDAEFQTERHAALIQLLTSFFTQREYTIEHKVIEQSELAFCRGCFDCWTKTPGECIMRDGIANINRACMTSDVVVYLCPIVFGQFSANMKYAIDRWLPNMLPFFITRNDGSTMHSPRYSDYAAHVFIGYGEQVSKAEAQLFTDINQKHRSNVEVIIDQMDDQQIIASLTKFSVCRAGGAL